MGTAWDVHRCARDPRVDVFPLSPVFRVRIYLCVCTPRWIWRMLGCYRQQRAPWSFWRTKATELPPPLPFLPSSSSLWNIRGADSGKLFRKSLHRKIVPFCLSNSLRDRSLSKKKRKSSNYHFVQPGNRIILLVNFTIEEEESNLINLIIDSEERITFDQNWNRNIRPRI